MPNDPTTTGNGPWRLLVLDRDPADPKWILATVATPGDVRPAWPSGTVDEDTAAWVAMATGHRRTETAPARAGIVAEVVAEIPQKPEPRM